MITKRANPLNLPFLFGPVPVLLGNLSVPPPPRQPARSAFPATDSFTVSSVGLEPEATSWLERGESLIVQQAFSPSCFDRQRCFFCFCSPVLAHTRFVCSVSILTTLPGTLCAIGSLAFPPPTSPGWKSESGRTNENKIYNLDHN